MLLYHYCLDEGGLSLDRILRGKGGKCRERLPNRMNKIRSCKSLELTCQKLKNKCHKNLGNAIRNSEDGRRCRYHLRKKIYRQRVNALCSLTCGTCGKSRQYSYQNISRMHPSRTSKCILNINCINILVLKAGRQRPAEADGQSAVAVSVGIWR